MGWYQVLLGNGGRRVPADVTVWALGWLEGSWHFRVSHGSRGLQWVVRWCFVPGGSSGVSVKTVLP